MVSECKKLVLFAVCSPDSTMEDTITTRPSLNLHTTEKSAREWIKWWESCASHPDHKKYCSEMKVAKVTMIIEEIEK